MAVRLKYQFNLTKKAVVKTPMGIVPVGDVEEYFDNNGDVRVTVKFFDNVPDKLIAMCKDNPAGMSLVAEASQPHDIKLIGQPKIG